MEINKSILKKHQSIEESQRVYLRHNASLIIRLDGRGVTRNRETYHLIPYAEWREPIMRAAEETVKYFAASCDVPCSVKLLGGMDEVSIVYMNGSAYLGLFENTNAIYAGAIFLQEFTRRLRGDKHRETDFGISIFSLQEDLVEEYLGLRSSLIHKAALDYIIKVNNMGWCDEPAVMRGIYDAAEKRAEREDKKEQGFLNGCRKEFILGPAFSEI